MTEDRGHHSFRNDQDHDDKSALVDIILSVVGEETNRWYEYVLDSTRRTFHLIRLPRELDRREYISLSDVDRKILLNFYHTTNSQTYVLTGTNIRSEKIDLLVQAKEILAEADLVSKINLADWIGQHGVNSSDVSYLDSQIYNLAKIFGY